MRYLNDGDVTQMMGIGYLGEVRQGPDGNLYQYVQGVDGLGNPVGGFWSKLKRLAKRALPIAQRIAPFIPGGSAALTMASPFLKQVGVAGYGGIGELYEAPDGRIYQVQGIADDGMHGVGEAEMNQMMGVGYLGEVRQGSDGNLYQYVQGVDGLGNPVGGFWSKLKRLAKRALPIAQKLAPFIPGGSAALTMATPFLKQAGIAGYGGIGELYAAPDGTVYQMQGLADDDLHGFDGDEDLSGLEDDDLNGLDGDDELRGFDGDEDLNGLEDDDLSGLEEDELNGFDGDEDLQGFDANEDLQGYVRQAGMNGLERYEPEPPPQTRWHVASAPSDVWKPLW